MPKFPRFCSIALAMLLGSAMIAEPAWAQSAPPRSISSEDADFLRPISDPSRTPSPAMVKRSVELYNEGVAHAQAGRLKDAYRAFRDAYEQDGSAEALANAAVLEAKLGRARSAAEHLSRAISRLPKDRTDDAAALKQRLDEVATELGTVRVSAPPMSIVEVDGKWEGSTYVVRTFYLDPGPHDVLVSAFGGDVKRRWMIKKGDKISFDVTESDLRRAASAALAAASPAPPLAPDNAQRSRLPWILGGAGVAFAAIGGAGLGVYLRGHDERVKIEAETQALGGFCGPTPPPGFVDDCRARDQEATNETIGMVLAIAGLSGLGAVGAGAILSVVLAPATGAPAAYEPPRIAVGLGPASLVMYGNF